MYVQGASLRGRPTPPATLAQGEKVHQIANWRLDNAKNPAAMLQEKTARTLHALRVADVVRTIPQVGYLFSYFDMLHS